MLAVYVVLYNGTTLWHTIGRIEIVMTCYGGKSKFADVACLYTEFPTDSEDSLKKSSLVWLAPPSFPVYQYSHAMNIFLLSWDYWISDWCESSYRARERYALN